MIDRRQLLALGLAWLAACDGPRTVAARWLGADVPAFVPPASDTVDPFHRLLVRAGFGPWPGDVEEAREMGTDGWIESQLHPESLDDSACTAMARRFDSLQAGPGDAAEWEDETLRRELQRYALLRAVHSRRQVHESLVAFFADHLNVSIHKPGVAALAPHYVREVLRPHALGQFGDLLRASARSPAMLVYLDGADNALRKPGDVPQENYARELLELHTLGVRGGYDQRDVMEVARALTGFVVRERLLRGRGSVAFEPAWHDDGAKSVLGTIVAAGGGEDDLDAVIDIVVAHPSTARHLATRLTRWFVGDPAPPEVVEDAARTFATTEGDLRATVGAILRSDALLTAPPRLKRPFRFVVSAFRALGAVTQAREPVVTALERMGQAPHAHPTPDGYPFEAHPWLGSLYWRFAFARGLDGPGTQVPWAALSQSLGDDPAAWFAHLVGRRPTAGELAPLASGPSPREVVALILSSPAFQVT